MTKYVKYQESIYVYLDNPQHGNALIEMVLREWLEKMVICLETWPGIVDDLHYHEFDDIVELRMIKES